MTVTFLLAVNLDDLSTLADVAGDIEEDLVSAGHDVVSVRPWARPTQNPPPILTDNNQQPQQQQT